MNPPSPPDIDPAVPAAPAEPARRPFLWPVFLAAVLVPPVLTSVAAMMDHRGAAAPALMFLGGAAGGLVSGILLGCRVGKTTTTKAILSVVFCGLMTVAVISMCGFGCALGNYRLDFK